MQYGANGEPKIGRWRAAWYVLMGERLTPLQMQAEWVEYQQIFTDLLDRWSAKLARDAKAEKERIKRLDKAAVRIEVPQRPDTKASLRQRVAAMKGVKMPPNVTYAKDPANVDHDAVRETG